MFGHKMVVYYTTNGDSWKIRRDRGHGSPYDRGSADSWYRRPRNPHFYEGASYTSGLIEECGMTAQQIEEYHRGYDDNEARGEYKEWD